jgi:hypothetical protein
MKVVHCKKSQFTHYCGRPSPLGNPFTIGKDGDRDEVITKYEEYARNTPKIMAAIKALPEDAVLACWCHPKACHCDIIVKIWKELQ